MNKTYLFTLFEFKKLIGLRKIVALLTFNRVEKKSKIISGLLATILKLFPLKLTVSIFPKFTHALIANYYVATKQFYKFEYVVASAQEYKLSSKYAFSMHLDALRDQSKYEEIDNEIKNAFDNSSINSGKFDATVSWGFWNLSHKKFGEMLQNLKNFLEADLNSHFGLKRFLPDFSRNLGHLSCLYLYENFYREQENREIYIENGCAANKYYLEMLIRSSKLKINLIEADQFPLKNIDNIKNFDTLLYSFELQNSVRIESDASNSFYQFYPEWLSSYHNHLKMNKTEYDKGFDVFRKIIGNKWFVIFHVREPSDAMLVNGQARDSNINSYKLLADYINDNGGAVIRMGERNLPSLEFDFKAYDYAKSEIKSEFLDCWLWANCRYWVGNVNGAMLTALTFGKSRLITNQWYWNLYGGPNDLVLPKLLLENENLLSISETINSVVSRQMNRNYMKNKGFSLSENTDQDILNGFMDLEKNISSENVTDLDIELRKELKVNYSNKGVMRIAPSYSKAWEKLLTNKKI